MHAFLSGLGSILKLYDSDGQMHCIHVAYNVVCSQKSIIGGNLQLLSSIHSCVLLINHSPCKVDTGSHMVDTSWGGSSRRASLDILLKRQVKEKELTIVT